MHQTVARQVVVLGWGFAFFVLGCDSSRSGSDLAYPQRAIKVIVPFAAGGGSDTFARIISTAVEEQGLLSEPLVIINVPGAGGTIGSRRVKNARPDGYTVLLLHEGILTAKHSGQASYGPEAFTPIAGTSDATQVIAVAGDSPIENLSALMDSALSTPDTVVFSANVGAPSHFAGLMLEAEKPGASFRYTQTGGGAKRFAALQGGHVDVSAFSIAEYVQFAPSGMRALALLGPDRNADLPDVPTAQEQGFDVISQNMQFWWAPLGTPVDRVETVAAAVCSAMNSPSVEKQLSAMKIAPVALRGEALEQELDRRSRRITAVAPRQNADLPNFPMIALVLTIVIAGVSLVRARSRSRATEATCPPLIANWSSFECFTLVGIMTIAYAISLHSGVLGFIPCTAVYAFALSGTLAKASGALRRPIQPRVVASILIVTTTMSFGMHFLFTKVLVVDLP
ncbi:tripartite tricarboxylate transporter substrate-binding protein [Rubripirellula reticaptiva]|uniref:tripartite tricarboxylate transporter substrate-binding protein n=1 Tax=Rubripirellula reticaptiva TaxID=2528013 RepID=UPI0016483CD9|nr:tripartite tricarboxylate transporter substrate-binding protein [Rubripirellula reticaptiva]